MDLDIGCEKNKRNHGRVCVFMDDYMNKEKIKNNIEKRANVSGCF